MSIDGLENKADLLRWLEDQLEGRFRPQAVRPYPEVDEDPPAPMAGVIVYCIADNGAGKRALRARFPTGAVQVLSTEP